MEGGISELKKLPRSICETWKRKLLKLHAGARGLEKPGIEDALCFRARVASRSLGHRRVPQDMD